MSLYKEISTMGDIDLMGPIKKMNFRDHGAFFVLYATIITIFLGYVFYRAYQGGNELISIMIIPLIAGVVMEDRRLGSDRMAIIVKILIVLPVSLFTFVLDVHEPSYNFDDRIMRWPYVFVFLLTITSIFTHQEKVIPKMTEGITLLQSLSILYWALDMGLFSDHNIFVRIVVGIGLIFSVFAIFHAFSDMKLTRQARLQLSIGSSIIMIIFAIDNMYSTFHTDIVLNYNTHSVLFFVQYFLLGVSMAYILVNAWMLQVYLPSRYRHYGKEHMKNIKEMNEEHIKRYSDQQIDVIDALIALIVTVGIYSLNYEYQFLPRATMIWLLFWIFPFVIYGKNVFMNSYSNEIVDNKG